MYKLKRGHFLTVHTGNIWGMAFKLEGNQRGLLTPLTPLIISTARSTYFNTAVTLIKQSHHYNLCVRVYARIFMYFI